jgi:tRNA threonylcarbamoyladenosine biosynthesis protein TsaB
MISLAIDTTDRNEASISVNSGGNIRKYQKIQKIPKKSQILLPLIEQAFIKSENAFDEISDISVATGPGSFTGIRVGITAAQILGLLLAVPVNNLPPGTVIAQEYFPNKFD